MSKKVSSNNKMNKLLLEKEEKLVREVNELRSFINKAKNASINFENIQNSLPTNLSSIPVSRISNPDISLQTELFKYVGLSCIKFSRTEYVFQYNYKKEVFTVQFIKRSRKWELGKWIMPMSIDMDQLLLKQPIENSNNIIKFLKHLRHHIECYKIRFDEFKLFKDVSDKTNNLNCHSNLGYTQITLEFFKFYLIDENLHLNIIVQLIYNSDEIRPNTIIIDSAINNELSKIIEIKLKSIMKIFKTTNLTEAFEGLLKNTLCSLSKEKDDNISLISDSLDEDSEIELKSMKQSNKRKHKLEQDGKRKKRLKKDIQIEKEVSDDRANIFPDKKKNRNNLLRKKKGKKTNKT